MWNESLCPSPPSHFVRINFNHDFYGWNSSTFNRSFMCIDCTSLKAHARWQHDVHTIQAINDMLLSVHRFFVVIVVAFFGYFYNFVPFYLLLFPFVWLSSVKEGDILRRGQMSMRVVSLHLLIFTWLLLHYTHVMANGLPLHNIGIYKMIAHCLCQQQQQQQKKWMNACTHAHPINRNTLNQFHNNFVIQIAVKKRKNQQHSIDMYQRTISNKNFLVIDFYTVCSMCASHSDNSNVFILICSA